MTRMADSQPAGTGEDDDDEVQGTGQRRVTMRTIRIAEVVYDVRQYWGLRKLLIDVLLLACHFLASNFSYQPLSGESRAYAQQVLFTAVVNGVPDNRPNPITLFDAGTLTEAMDMLCSSLTYWGETSYGPDDHSMYLGQSSLRVRALVIQIDPLNQCDWGTEVTYPPLCYRDDPVAEAEFANTTRWVRVVGEDAAPRSSLVRWWYPTGESAGTLKEGFKLGYTPKPDLNYPILLDHFDQRDYQDRVDLFCSKSDIIASYSKFIQLFVITEHILTGEVSHQRVAFDRSIPPMDSGMLFAATTPRIIVWNSASPIFSWPERSGVACQPQNLALVFHVAALVLMLFVVRDLMKRFRAVRHHRRCVRILKSQHLHMMGMPKGAGMRATRRDNIEALLVILKPCSWTSFDVCVLLYGLLFENVIWHWVLLVPPFAVDTGTLTVADVLRVTMHSNSCIVWICLNGVFVACLFFRLFESVFKFRRLAMYVRVFELAFGQFKDYAVIFLSLLMCGSLGFSFVCQGIGGGLGFSNYSSAINSWSLFVFRFYDYRTFSQDGKWVGFGLPLMGIAFFWVAVILCVIFSQNIILAVIMAAHNAAVGELEESYGLDCQVSFAMYCSYRAFQSMGRLFSVATALFVRGGRRRRNGGLGYALGGLVRDLQCLIESTRAKGLGWIHFHNQVAPAPRDAAGAGAVPGSPSKAGGAGGGADRAANSPRRSLFEEDAAAVPAGAAAAASQPSRSLLSRMRMRLGLGGSGLDDESPLEKDVLDAATAFGLAPSGQPNDPRGASRWFPSSDQMHQCLSRWELIEDAAPILLRLVEFYTNPASGRLHDKSPFASVLAREGARRNVGFGGGGGGGGGALGFGEGEIPALSASLDAHEMALLLSRMRVLMALDEGYQPQPLEQWAVSLAAAGGSVRAGGSARAGGSYGGASAGGSLLSHHVGALHLPNGTARSSLGTGRSGGNPGQQPGSPSAGFSDGGSEVGSVASPGVPVGVSYERQRTSGGGGSASHWAPRHPTQRPTEEEVSAARRLRKLYGSVPTNNTRKPGVQLSTLGQMASIQGQMHRIQRPLRERGWDSFISYSRENAEGQVSELRLDLLMVGHKAWVDVNENCSPEGTFQGIMQSDMFVLYLTRGVLSHAQSQLELAAALDARKLIVLVRECRQQMFYRDADGEFRNACASVTEVREESPPEFHPVFEACLALEATDYKDVSERRLFVEHLTGGKNAQIVDVDPETLFRWTKTSGEFPSGRHLLDRLSEGFSEGEARESEPLDIPPPAAGGTAAKGTGGTGFVLMEP